MFWLFQLERRICSILCCLLCAGPVLIAIGMIVLFSATHDSRGDAITQFNNAVEAWNSTYRDQFAALQTNVFVAINNGNFTAYPVSTGDPLNDDDPKIKTWTPLKYVTTLNTIFGTKQWSTNNNSYLAVLNLASSISTQVVLTTNYGTVATTCKNTDMFCDDCTNKQGAWVGGQCQVKQALTDYCITLGNTGASWAPSGQNGQYGCGANGNWAPTTFSTIPSGTTTYTFSGPFTIRSVYDPYVVAARVTGGNYNFGLTRGQKARIGLILIIVGGVFMAPIIIVTVLCYKHLAKKHNHHHHHHHHHGYSTIYGTH